jgi:hypothetical protein
MRKHDLDERAHRTAMSDVIKKLRAQNIDLVFEGAATAQTAGATPAASTAAVAPESLTPSTQKRTGTARAPAGTDTQYSPATRLSRQLFAGVPSPISKEKVREIAVQVARQHPSRKAVTAVTSATHGERVHICSSPSSTCIASTRER